MTNAIITQTIYNPLHDFPGFADAIASAWVGGGLGTLFDSWAGGDGSTNRVFETVLNNSVAKKNCYLQIQLPNTGTANSTRTPQAWIFDAFNTTTHTGSNSSTGSSPLNNAVYAFSFTSNQPIVINTISHPEIKLLYLAQAGVTSPFIGIFRPLNIPSWWNENSFLYAFNPLMYGGLFSFYPLASTGNPLTVATAATIVSSPAIAFPNTITGKRDIIRGISLVHPANNGIIGRSSADLALVAASGMSFGQKIVVTPQIEEYTLITNGGTPGIAVRTV